VEIDGLIERLLQVSPQANIGRGPEHPTRPELALATRIATWLSVHPFLSRDAGYVDFLRRYSGVQVLTEYSAQNVAKGLDWDLRIPGFAPQPRPLGKHGCLDYTGGHGGRLDPTVRHIDKNGFYNFGEVFFRHSGGGDEPSDWAYEEFGFDASGERRSGVYRILDPPEWFCENFLQWLTQVIERRGRVVTPQNFLSDLLEPEQPEPGSKSRPSRLALSALYCGLAGMISTLLCMGIVGVPLGIVGAILASIALVRRKKGDTGPAVAGLILSILAFALLPVVGFIVAGDPWPFR
jgi:hypothetical protein